MFNLYYKLNKEILINLCDMFSNFFFTFKVLMLSILWFNSSNFYKILCLVDDSNSKLKLVFNIYTF